MHATTARCASAPKGRRRASASLSSLRKTNEPGLGALVSSTIDSRGEDGARNAPNADRNLEEAASATTLPDVGRTGPDAAGWKEGHAANESLPTPPRRDGSRAAREAGMRGAKRGHFPESLCAPTLHYIAEVTTLCGKRSRSENRKSEKERTRIPVEQR